ncbi:MAG: archease [Candidatus Pacearchaeota archaeon]|nr:MAG: archease [Candidatus Pacearchaeota archaeon]
MDKKKKKFDFLEHTADIKFRVYGKNLEEVFENVVSAISEYISRGKKVKVVNKKTISLITSENDLNLLLYSFLEELLYFLDAKNFIPAKAKVKIKEGHLKAVIYGDKASDYKNLDQIKSPTYSEMYIKNLGKNRGWEAQFVVDV